MLHHHPRIVRQELHKMVMVVMVNSITPNSTFRYVPPSLYVQIQFTITPRIVRQDHKTQKIVRLW